MAYGSKFTLQIQESYLFLMSDLKGKQQIDFFFDFLSRTHITITVFNLQHNPNVKLGGFLIMTLLHNYFKSV